MKKRIAILGSTGSIGTQALSVIRTQPEVFAVASLSAGRNAELLVEQAREFLPRRVVIGDASQYQGVKAALKDLNIQVDAGAEALEAMAADEDTDMVLSALVGFAGLKPTLAAIEAGKDIALANKETLVVAGDWVMQRAKAKGVQILPVDSEHSAIFQCLMGEQGNAIERVILTASGGPFRGKDKRFLAQVTPQQALKHPNWDMGQKITIDCASLMNKGLEAIEAKWLFDLKPAQIEVVIHPQSIIHSLVQFTDGSLKAQMGLPDMKLPIQVALAYPERLQNNFRRFDFMEFPSLTFEKPDGSVFQNLALAYEAMEKGGIIPCVLNAANEVAVAAFLRDELGFLEMSDVIAHTMAQFAHKPKPVLSDYVEADKQSRSIAAEQLSKNRKIQHTINK